MGGAIVRARNAEVSVYRRFPPGQGLKVLGLDLSRVVEKSRIRPPKPSNQIFESGASATPAGSVEVVERSLTWWPPNGAEAKGAAILIHDETFATAPIGNGQYRTQLTMDPIFPLVVKVRFGNGKISDPIIVHDETALRIASPGVTDRRLRNAFDRVQRGEDDIIDLALQAHLIFEPAGNQEIRIGRATRTGRQATEGAEKRDYSTPEEFRQGVSLKPANGRSGRFSVEDPGLLDLLAIILRGVTDVAGKEARRRQDEEEAADLIAGENEDGDELAKPEREEEPEVGAAAPSTERGQRIFTPAQIERRRSQLKKAIGSFEKMLQELSAKPNGVSGRLTAQTIFILNLMLFACTKEHRTADGTSIRLMALAPGSTLDREITFAVRAGRILQTIWLGGRGGSIIDKLEVDRRHGSVTDDIFFLIVMSRWAIARACLATADRAGKDGLTRILQSMAIKIYQASTRCGPVDAEAEYRFMIKLDEVLGFTEADTAKLVRECRRLAATVEARTISSETKAAS